ncbi:cation diffusion facilitator family transporter [Rhodopseudomonas palustris TIE-1]|uniref:cation diffusion facilitator family transporter n=1 Tax=Rhodopseudomonas palustris TaxID=1076 RepID=UPI00017797CC|nr:cation diffusion facilitator family transporter [Rhodopseudomonas palustris TIE-1]
MAAAQNSRLVIYAALAGNALVALSKFGAAAWTGSSAMLSEAIHSLVDTVNQLLMLYGLHRAAQPADAGHPLGYGRELYFWSFIVSLLIFSLGAGISLYEGIQHILRPEPVSDPHVNYLVLAASLVFEGASWTVAIREFEKQRGGLSYLEAATRSRDPTSFLVLFEDSAAVIGILIAATGTAAAEWLEMPVLDGVASVGIALVLAATAAFLARESKELLLGEPAREQVRTSMSAIVTGHPGVAEIGRMITVHLAPEQIVAAVDVDFVDDLRASQIEQTALSLRV